MSNLIEYAAMDSAVVPGTHLWCTNDNMARRKGSSNIDRPMLVIAIRGQYAQCVPTSSSSDGWNEMNPMHCIPREVNPTHMDGRDSYLCVNRTAWHSYQLVSLSEIQSKRRIILPIEYVYMTQQLVNAYTSDKKHGRLRTFDGPMSKNRTKSRTVRADITTMDIIHKYWSHYTK